MGLGKVIFVDASNKPADFPTSKWPIKDNLYNVIEAFKDMNGTLTFVLEEINLEGCYPYLGFAATRFRQPTPEEIIQEQINETIEELV